MKLFKVIKENTIVLYIANKKMDVEDCFNDAISHINIVYNSYEGDDSATIMYIMTSEKYRNKGFATKLLEETIKILKEKNIKKIELDDMSSNARTTRNIYINFGFKYINPYPEPEMILNL